MDKISVCITTWNRSDMVIKSFSQVLDHPRVDEVVIVDDHSDTGFYKTLQFMVDRINSKKKIRLYQNPVNLGCYHNKRAAVAAAKNDWVILLDSDNTIDNSYIDSIPNISIATTIYAPVFARPTFDFRQYAGKVLTKGNIAALIDKPWISTALNAMNYCVNKFEYLAVWEPREDPLVCDSLLQNYNFISNGGHFYFCTGMEYDHLIHDGSHYKQNVKKTPKGLHDEIIEKFKKLR
jgi:glycosyltransferase involved in cell wall biosynthesis